jgi:hypothetical protein
MAAPNIGRRSHSLSPLAARFVVIGLVSLGLAARAQDRSANDEAIAALADIEPAIGELTASSDLMANTGRPYKQAAQRAAAAVAGALGRLDWLTDHAGGNVWGLGVEGSRVNLRIAKGDLDAAAGTDGLEQFWSEASSALQVLLVAAGRESTVGVLGGLRGALATTTLGIPADATTVSGCGLPAKAPAYGVIDGYLTYIAIPDSGVVQLPHPIGIRKVSFGSGYVVLHTAASDLIGRLCPAGQTAAVTSHQAGNDAPAR